MTQVVWDYVPSLLPWQPAWACSVQVEWAALWCRISWVEGASVCSLSPVTSSLIPLLRPHTWIRRRVVLHVPSRWRLVLYTDEWHKCVFSFSFNSLYQPHLSVNSSERKTSAIFWKCDNRIWGWCPGLVWPPCSKLDWISNMFLFIMLQNTLKCTKGPLVWQKSAIVQTSCLRVNIRYCVPSMETVTSD